MEQTQEWAIMLLENAIDATERGMIAWHQVGDSTTWESGPIEGDDSRLRITQIPESRRAQLPWDATNFYGLEICERKGLPAERLIRVNFYGLPFRDSGTGSERFSDLLKSLYNAAVHGFRPPETVIHDLAQKLAYIIHQSTTALKMPPGLHVKQPATQAIDSLPTGKDGDVLCYGPKWRPAKDFGVDENQGEIA